MIAFDTEKFFSWDGKDLTTTLEFWMRATVSGKKEEHCLIGFTSEDFYDSYGDPYFDTYSINDADPYFDVDGVFLAGNVLYVRHQGQHICSAAVPTIEYPTLVDIGYTSDSISIMLNGETVSSAPTNTFKQTIPIARGKSTSWYFEDDRKFAVVSNKVSGDYDIELNNIAMYPYLVAGVVAKKRFIRGQGVEDIDLLNNSMGAESLNCSYDAAAQSPAAVYSNDFSWDSGYLSNLEVLDGALALNRLAVPEVSGKILFDTYDSELHLKDSFVRFNGISQYVSEPDGLYYSGDAGVVIDNASHPKQKIVNDVYGSSPYWVLETYGESDVYLGPLSTPLKFTAFDDKQSYVANFMNDLPSADVTLSNGKVKFFGICSKDNMKNETHDASSPRCSYLWGRKTMPGNETAPIQSSIDIGNVGYYYDNIAMPFFVNQSTDTLKSLQFNFTYPAKPLKKKKTPGASIGELINYEPYDYISWGSNKRYVNMYVVFTPYNSYFVPEFKRLPDGNQSLPETALINSPEISTKDRIKAYPIVDSTTLIIPDALKNATMHMYVDFHSPGQETVPLKLDYMKITPNHTNSTLTRDGHIVTLPDSGKVRIAPQTNEYLYRGKETGWLNLDQGDSIDFDTYSETKVLSFFFKRNFLNTRTNQTYIQVNDEQIKFVDIDRNLFTFEQSTIDNHNVYINGEQVFSKPNLVIGTWYHVQFVKNFGLVEKVSLGPDVIFDNVALFEDDKYEGRLLSQSYTGRNSKTVKADPGLAVIEGTSRVFNNVKRSRYEVNI